MNSFQGHDCHMTVMTIRIWSWQGLNSWTTQAQGDEGLARARRSLCMVLHDLICRLLVEAQMTRGNDRHSWKDWQAKSGKVVDREFHLERDWESVWICWIRACATLQIQCWNMVERFADAFDAMGELWIIGRGCYLHVALNGGVESIQVSIFDIQDIHE